MGYYIRVLGSTDSNIHTDELVSGLTDEGLAAKFSFDENECADNWTVINVSNSNGVDLMKIERNPVKEGKLGKEEIEAFKKNIKEYKPSAAVKWLTTYFDNVRVIYAFQLHNASMENVNFPIINSIKSTIWRKVGGILQSDNEGFSNEDGYHILWQFSDKVTGEWNMAVKNFFGKWVKFTMDLGDNKQREDFWAGKIPKNAKKL